jgi:hypothetical protein
MRKLILHLNSTILFLLFISGAHAQIVSGNGFFKGTFVEAGIQPTGAFGSLVSAPSDYVSATVSKYSGRVGFIADVGKDGWTVGTPKYIGDFFVPGTPYEAFSVKMNGTLYENAGSAAGTIPGTVTGFSDDGTTASIEWTGNKNNLQIRQITSVGKNSSFILIRVYIKNTGSSAINNIYYTRSVDPDNEVDQVGSAAYTTINKVENQNPNSTSTALVSGKGQTYGSYLGLGSRDCRARVAIMSSFSSDGESIFNGNGLVALSAQGSTNTADDAIAVAFKLGTLAAGDSTTLAMAYVLNSADLPPAMDQTDPLFNVKADTYGSGSVINVCSGSQAALNIVNGDGYTWTWSPATGLDQTTGRSVNATLTGDIMYTASGVNTCGTNKAITLNLHPVVSATPANAGTISGLSTVYKGWNATFSVPAIANATSYKWTIPTGASFVSGFGTNTIVVKFGTSAVSGAVQVYGENSCGSGVLSTLNVTMNTGASSLVISSGNNSIPSSASFGTATNIDTKVTITGTDPITNTRVYIDGGFQAGDELIYDSLLPTGVTAEYSASTGGLSFTGTATPTQWQDIFKAVKFKSTSSNVADRSVKFVLGDMVSLTIGGKPHYYEYITPTDLPTWAEAYTGAASRTFYGLSGYLATVSSSTENDFIKLKLSTDGWVGGSDDYSYINLVKGTTYTNQTQTEGKWFWINGPEAGNAISTGNDNPVVASGGYMNWNTEEPNNVYGNEHYMQFYSGDNGKWNDLNGNAIASVPGYVVEYGGYSSDPTISIEYSRTLKNISDETPPAKPAKPVMTDGDGRNTNNPKPNIKGSTEANAAVKIYKGATLVATVTGDASGNWTYTFTSNLGDGEYNITTTSTDAAGNTSAASDALVINIDTEFPDSPSAPVLKDGVSGVINSSTPTVTGIAEPKSTINVYSNGIMAGTVITAPNGEWSYTFSPALEDATYNVAATATDTAGNMSELSSVTSITVDTQKPATPVEPILETDNNLGNVKINNPAISGEVEPGDTVSIYNGSVLVTTVIADGTGKWNYTFSPALTDGNHSITVTSTDIAGNKSDPGTALTIIVDTQNPVTPDAPELTGGSDGNINTSTPTITGTTEPGAVVTIYKDGTALTTVTADGSGHWTYTFSPALTDGNYNITTTSTDMAGNTSDASEALSITVDTHNPDKPTAPILTDGTSGNINTSTPTVTGNAEPNSTVTVYVNGTDVGTATADGAGNWTYTFSPALEDGTYSIAITSTDAAGNTSTMSDPATVKVDTQKPETPVAPSLESDNNDGSVKTNQPVISGVSEPNSTISIYDGTTLLGTVIADASGNWTYTFSPALTDGNHDITTTSTDAAGNISDPGGVLNITVDTQKPVTPSVPLLSGGNDGSTNINAPTIGGTTEPGATVTIYNNGIPVATVTADGSGNWTYTFSPALSDGSYDITTTSTDDAGNTSDPSSIVTVTVDTQKPAVPTGNTLDNGKGDYINTPTPTVSGIAEPGSVVTIYNNGVPAGTAIAGTDGKWSYTFSPALPDGTYNISTTSTDKAGNTSDQTGTFTMIVDTQIPVTPQIPAMTGDDSTGHFNTNTPTISGHAEPGSVITIYDNGVPVATVTVDAGGNWSYTFDPALSDGNHLITTTVTDLAGNTSEPSTTYVMHVDTKLPTVYIVSGKYEANAPFTATITFSEAVKGFSPDGIRITNGKISNFTQISPTQYTIIITPLYSNSSVTVQVTAASAEDVSGNWNGVSNMMKVEAAFSAEMENVFPNPATNSLNIHFKGITSAKGRIMLVKMSGQIVYDAQVAIENNTITLDINKYAAGQYVLVVKTNEYMHRTNVMILR